jgi:uncharacterized protein YcbX
MSQSRVTSIHVYPRHGEPGVGLDTVAVEKDGLDGDRRKRAPVHLVAAEASEGVRANFVLEASARSLAEAEGRTLTVGGVELEVIGMANNCPGVYAAVRRTGTVRIGDPVYGLKDAERTVGSA